MNKIKRIKPENLDVVILCGGIGKRLKSILGTQPKPMAEINGRPFLDILIEVVANFGFKRFILCIGYMGKTIKQYYEEKKNPAIEIFLSEEAKPLGTAGAVKNAESIIRSSPFLVMNGDSLCKLNLYEFINFHKDTEASFSMVLVKSRGSDDCGRVRLDNSQRIISFDEKVEAQRGDLINAGIYLLEKSLFPKIPSNKKFSLEYELFPKLVKEKFYGYITNEELMDIGTPDRYLRTKQQLTRNFL